MTTPLLQTTVDRTENRQREQQRAADIELADHLLVNPPSWADPNAFRAAWYAVWEEYPDPEVWREERIVPALLAYVCQSKPVMPGPWDTSARAVAIRAYARWVRWERTRQTLLLLCDGVMLGVVVWAACQVLKAIFFS